MTTPILGLQEIDEGVEDQSPLHNQALRELEGRLVRVLSRTTTTMPVGSPSPAEGASYIVPLGSPNTWDGTANQIATFIGGAFSYYTPIEGVRVWVNDEDTLVVYSGSQWTTDGLGGGSTAGRHAIPVTAGSIAPSASGGCAPLTSVVTSANRPDIISLDFDPTTQEYAQFSIAMPKSWDEGTVTFKAVWSHAAFGSPTPTQFGVVWDLQAVAVSDDDTVDVAYGTAQTVADTGGTANDLYVSPESSAITIAGTPQAEDVVFFRVSRVTGNGSDTFTQDARLHGIILYITTNADTDE